MSARLAVIEILRRFEKGQDTFEAAIDKVIARSRVDHRDRRFVFELANGVVRQRIRLDYIIENFLTDRHLVTNRDLMRILELGVYQLVFMDRVPHHAAVSESVELAKNDTKVARMAGIVNAVLRAVIAARGQVALPDPQKDLALRLSIEYSHPKWLVERWLATQGLSKTKTALTFNNQIPATYFRRRMRGISRQQFETDSRDLCVRVPSFQNLYYRFERKAMAPEEVRLFQLGYCTVQAPSAGWVVGMLDPKTGERIVDVCSAPGGKAALLAEMVGEDGSVVGCDSSPQRLWRLVQTRDRMNLREVYPVVCDGRSLPFAGHFDKALLDVPCSGTGVLHRHPDARATRTMDDITAVLPLQAQLLDAAAGLVGRNGILVYSTCSLEPEENEKQVEAFLQRHPEYSRERPPA